MSNVTIIIPTYNRSVFLRRLLSYYSRNKVNCKFIIADSSKEQIKEENEKIISSFNDLDINYLNNFANNIKPNVKMIKAINLSSTPYSLLCADDDFTSPNAIKICLDFLEKNPNYICAGGDVFCFFTRRNRKGNEQFYWNDYLPHKKPYMNITHPDAKSRLTYYFSNYFPTIYYVHRTKFLKLFHKKIISYTNDVRFGELLPAMLTVIHGKVKTFDIFYGARDHNPLSTGSTAKRITDYIRDGSYDEKYAKFSKCLSEHLLKNEDLNLEKAGNIIDQSMKLYLDTLIIKEKPLKFRSYLRRFLINLSQYRKISFKQRINLNNWNLVLPSSYDKEFSEVKKAVLENYEDF